jgi:preprotein translocase subunit SecA
MADDEVQLLGDIALYQRKICEMATGEGKTLVATLSLYLSALSRENCQLILVNDELARRDGEWTSSFNELLGRMVECLQKTDLEERQKAYVCKIACGTASEFEFDDLLDNGTAISLEEQIQCEHCYCIVDEVDFVP